ncbi:MAG: MarR family winged helix-turn-helix transcriptional regulator [Chloroflexota bacterium]
MRGERPPLAIQIVLLGKHLAHLLEHRLANRGLNRTQTVVLTVLGHHPGLQALELCRPAGVEPANVTRTLQSLERMGFLERRPHPSDGRANLFFLTEAGQKLARELSEEIQEVSATLLERVDREDLPHVEAVLRGLWESVSYQLSAASHLPSAVGCEPGNGGHVAQGQSPATGDSERTDVMSHTGGPNSDG